LDTPPAEIVARFELLNEWDQPFDVESLPGRRVFAGEHSSSALLHVRERHSGRGFWSMIRAGAVLGSDGKPELAVNIWHDVSAERREERQAKYLADATVALGTSLDYDRMLLTLAKVLVPELTDWCSIHLLEGSELRHVVTVHVNAEKTEVANDYQQRFPPDPASPTGVWNVLRTGKPELYEDITDELLVRSTNDLEKLAILREVGPKSAIIAPLKTRGKLLGVLSLVSAESGRRYDASHLSLAMELAERAGGALENARLYRAAQESAQAAERASRAKDEFLATVSHELRTPLNAIVGWASLLKARVTDPAFVRPVEIIHRNAEAQVKIIDDILDVSRVITGKFRIDARPTDMVVIARDAIEVVRPSALAKAIEIQFSTVKDFCLLVADPERLQQVVWNLLSNAVKFTSTGGKICVKIGQERSNVTLSVTDTGAGIDPEFLPFVFDRFSQADPTITRRVGGLGLGLALVRHIVELHGGNASASSSGRGNGATFTITLPVRAVSPHAVESASISTAATSVSPAVGSLSGVNVLIVDDEPDARELLGVVLTNAGANVQTARSAAEGLMVLQRFRPDVLVSDIGMPDEDGFAFIQKVRRLPANEGGAVPAVALTAYTRDEDRARAKDAGYDLHVGKPVNPSALAATVANLATRVRA
jgi:signal transduction histidine kinase/CheY-like chemotaxis protein